MKALFISLAVVATLVIVAGVVVIGLRVRQGMPIFGVSLGPNAFDYFEQAAALEVDSSKVDDAAERQPTHTYSLADKEALVQRNSAALAKLREGLQYSYTNPPVPSVSTKFPYYAKFRKLARLLHLQSEMDAAKGDYAGAASCDLDAIQMGEEIPHGSVLIGMLVGIACQAIGREPLWETMDHLNSAQAKQDAQRLNVIEASHFPLAGTWQVEKATGDSALTPLVQSPDYPQSILSVYIPSAPSAQSTPGESAAVQWIKSQAAAVSKQDFMPDYDAMMDKLIQAANEPYSLASVPQPGTFFLERVLLPVFNVAAIKERCYDEAENSLLETMLAIHAYKLDHRSLPASLTDLVPAYIPAVPMDPFADNQPLRYIRTGSRFVLYSVGPDGVDNEGIPIDSDSEDQGSPQRGPARFYVNGKSQGDIVAGINVP